MVIQGCSTLWDSNEGEQVFETGESCAVAVLAEGAGAGFAVHQDVEGEAAQSGDDARQSGRAWLLCPVPHARTSEASLSIPAAIRPVGIEE